MTKWGADKYFYDLADQLHYHLARRLNYTGPSLLTTLRRRTQLVISNDHPIFHDPQVNWLHWINDTIVAIILKGIVHQF